MGLLMVLDGDDTLWETEHLYDEARQMVRELVESYGLDGAAWEHLERRLDVERVADFGFSPERFPGSCRAAYVEIAGVRARDSEANAVLSAAQSPFDRPAPLYAETREFIENARVVCSSLVLFTKGDRLVQHRRVAESGLAHYFDAVVIADTKSSVQYSAFTKLYVGTTVGVSVGNSWRSDIEPALAAGYAAVWIDRHVWEHERVASNDPCPDHPALKVALDLSDVLNYAMSVERGAHGLDQIKLHNQAV